MAATTVDVERFSPPIAVNSPSHPPELSEIRPFGSGMTARWTTYVDQHPDATIFHSLGWKRAVERTFGHRFRGLAAMNGERIVGVLPLYDIRSFLAGRMLVSVPYATYGGIVADSPDIAESLFEAARELQNKTGACSLEFRSKERQVVGVPTRITHATFVRPLPATEKEIEGFLPRKARAAARRAVERHRLTAEFDPGNLEEVWTLYARSMRRLASPNYPLRFFEEIAGAFPGRHIVQLVRHEGRAVAGLFSFVWRDRVMPYFVGMDERADLYGLSHFLYAQSMRHAVQIGCRIYDFGRSRFDNPGPFEFKRLCGFEPTELQYQVVIAAGRAAPDLSPTSSRWTMARRVWRTLPLAITRPLGGWIARSIPG